MGSALGMERSDPLSEDTLTYSSLFQPALSFDSTLASSILSFHPFRSSFMNRMLIVTMLSGPPTPEITGYGVNSSGYKKAWSNTYHYIV